MLKILEKVFFELNHQNIQYVHFKSNEHMQASLKGDTDFDILVRREHFKALVCVLERFGFSYYRAVQRQAYVTISDYLFLDSESQNVLHFHLHTAFVVGAKFFKEYAFSCEDYLFEHIVFDEDHPVPMLEPSLELAMLWLRFSLKKSALQFFVQRWRIGADFLKESEWLQRRADEQQVLLYAKDLTGSDEFAQTLLAFLYNGKKRKHLPKLVSTARKCSKCFRTVKFVSIRYCAVRLLMVFNYVKQKLHMPIPYRRINPNGGHIIAIVGADGSGKSTLLKALKASLKVKVDVYNCYMGSGDGRSSLLRLPLIAAKRIAGKKITSSLQAREKSRSKITIYHLLWALTLALEKKKKLQQIWTARARGMTVLCDRYPQVQYEGINDGPLLQGWSNDPRNWKRKLANWEYEIYSLAERLKPDLLIKLLVDTQTALKRKPFERESIVSQKVDIIREIQIPAGKTTSIDATLPVEEVNTIAYHEISVIF